MPLACQPVAVSNMVTGSVTGPGAFTTICNIAAASLPAGIYHIECRAWYGAVAGGENDMQVIANGVVLENVPVDAAAASNTPVTLDFVINLDGINLVAIRSIAGAAGTYKATIVATKIRL